MKYSFKIFHLLVALSFLSLLISSCDGEKSKAPIPLEIMKSIIVDMQFAESYSIGLGFDTVSKADQFKKNRDSLFLFYSSILKHYNIDMKTYESALLWYQNRPEMMDTLMQSSVAYFQQLKGEFDIGNYEERGSVDNSVKIQESIESQDSLSLEKPPLKERTTEKDSLNSSQKPSQKNKNEMLPKPEKIDRKNALEVQ